MVSIDPYRALLPIALLAMTLPVLAGCLGADKTTPEATVSLDPLRSTATKELDEIWLPDAADMPELGVWARDWVEHYATTYANRISFTPINEQATGYLYGELEALGYTTEMRTYYADAAPTSTEPVGYDVIVATRPGVVEPDKHIGLIAHHDARYSSNEAAYDDGSGTAVVMALAKYFAEVDTRKSVTVLMFDGEELGLRASCYYVNDAVVSGERNYDMAFGYDMVGINWPGHDWKMYHMMDPNHVDILLPLTEHVYRDIYDLPEEGVEIVNTHDRNSDERRFREAGVPIFRWAGGRHAADYPHYHMPTDTYDNMVAFAGSEEKLAAGMGTVIWTSIAMLHAADQYDFPEQTLVEQDCYFAQDGVV